MPQYFDEDGNLVEGVIPPEEAKELIEKVTQLDSLKKSVEEKERELETLRGKDFNFRRFEKATEEEKAKLMEKMTEIEKAAVNEITSLRTEIDEGRKQNQESMKEKAIKALSAGDEELEKELEKAYQKSLEFGGKPKTQDDVITRMNEAYRYVKGVVPPVNALNSFTPNTPVFEKKSERFTDSERGKQILHEINPDLYPLEKK